MSKASEAANAVMKAIEDVCGLYGVQSLRMQSRTFMVEGAAGRFRPMYVGKWRDEWGTEHTRGMADMLLRPRVRVECMFEGLNRIQLLYPELAKPFVTVPVWVEAKSGKGRLSPDQHAFRHYVEGNGETYIVIHDDITPLLDWFKSHGVAKSNFPPRPRPIDVPATELAALPCRHCGEEKSQHIGPAIACNPRGVNGATRSNVIGKVYSPKIPRNVVKMK